MDQNYHCFLLLCANQRASETILLLLPCLISLKSCQKFLREKFTDNHLEMIISKKLANQGYKIGQEVSVGNNNIKIKIVGISKSSSYSASPVIYTSFSALNQIKFGEKSTSTSSVNAVVVKSGKVKIDSSISNQYKVLSISDLINDIPGYSAQNMTLSAMIYFLFLIVLLIIGVFMYVITLQKFRILA